LWVFESQTGGYPFGGGYTVKYESEESARDQVLQRARANTQSWEPLFLAGGEEEFEGEESVWVSGSAEKWGGKLGQSDVNLSLRGRRVEAKIGKGG